MLKDLIFSGIYRDENISVNVTLENPTDYSIESSTLVFSIMVRANIEPKALMLSERGLMITVARKSRTEKINAIPIWFVTAKYFSFPIKPRVLLLWFI